MDASSIATDEESVSPCRLVTETWTRMAYSVTPNAHTGTTARVLYAGRIAPQDSVMTVLIALNQVAIPLQLQERRTCHTMQNSINAGMIGSHSEA